MKIYILGSNAFMKEMVKVTDDLILIGYEASIHKDYRLLVSGDLEQVGESSEVKIKNNYLKENYLGIMSSDAVLLVNNTKHGIENYIGGNGLMELGQAYVNDKKIFLLNNMPSESLSYVDEVRAMQPVCLDGDLENIKKY